MDEELIYETDKIKVWKEIPIKSEEGKRTEKEVKEEGVAIKIGKDTLHAIGFNEIKTKDTNELVFIYKVKYDLNKNESPNVLYYVVNEEKFPQEKLTSFLNMLEAVGMVPLDLRSYLMDIKKATISMKDKEKGDIGVYK